MAVNPQRELSAIRSELSSIISELNSISDGIRYNFKGISNTVCANRIIDVANQCQSHLNTLYYASVREESDIGGNSGGGGR